MVKKIRRFLITSNDIMRSSVIWNIVASVLNAFQSVLLLIVMSRAVGLAEAGVFSIGNTTSNLFQTIGRFGCRSFQVSDVNREYKFREYHISRIISCLVMFLASSIYVIHAAVSNDYSIIKTITVICMCLNKIPDAYEDVYFGEYQKNERFDIASKCYAIRLLAFITTVTILILITGNLCVSMIISTVLNFLICIFFLYLTKQNISEYESPTRERVKKLIFSVLPLCIASFMTYYINAAPRNSIDKLMNDETQALYGYIAMPVFVVQLVVTFFSMPLYHKISVLWEEKKYKKYVVETIKQIVYVILITCGCVLGAWLLGVPVLSLVFGTDLAPYKTELMILMIASGFLGMSSLLLGFLTIMRCQNQTLISYIVVAIIAFVLSDKIVMKNGMRGACLIYLGILILLVTVFMFLFVIKLSRTVAKASDVR